MMRALRDFNLPKIVDDDKPIFKRIIADLFPGFEVRALHWSPRKIKRRFRVDFPFRVWKAMPISSCSTTKHFSLTLILSLLSLLITHHLSLIPQLAAKVDLKFNDWVKKCTVQQRMQPDEMFCLKVVSLKELLEIRHSGMCLLVWPKTKMKQPIT
jgi:hypothetical protein